MKRQSVPPPICRWFHPFDVDKDIDSVGELHVCMSVELDFSNLEERRETLRERYTDLNEFGMLFKGILLGVIISLPVQLMIKPLTLRNGELMYGSSTLPVPMNTFTYFFASLILFTFVFVGIPLGYRAFKGLNNRESVSIPFRGEPEHLREGLKDLLSEECEYRSVTLIPRKNRLICKDNRKDARGFSNQKILEAELKPDVASFDDDIGMLWVTFAPENSDALELLTAIEQRFSSDGASL